MTAPAQAYAAAVERAANALRPRFESGELRGWLERDGDYYTKHNVRPPLFKVEDACARRIRTPEQALRALRFSPFANQQRKSPLKGPAHWSWRETESASLHSAAAGVMAEDVVRYAKRRGWVRPAR